MKRISIIGIVGVPACYGGFESLVDNLLDFKLENVEYTVFCTAKKYENKLTEYKGAKLIYLPLSANGSQSIFYDFLSMLKSLKSDIMVILGVSGCIFLPFIRKIYKGKIITNIDGLEWKREKWNKFIKNLLHFSEKQAVKYSDVVVADNKGIVDYVQESYGKTAKLIEYGGDQAVVTHDDSLFEKYPYLKSEYAVTVCRIEPENNIKEILDAFSQLKTDQYVIVGNWNDNEYGKSLKLQYSMIDNIHLLDPIYDKHEINWIRTNATVYIHGHSAGGTNPSLVEAMNLGLPILAYKCVYNCETTMNACFYWENSSDIVKLMKDKKKDFSVVAEKMKEIGVQEYTWKEISKKYNDLFVD